MKINVLLTTCFVMLLGTVASAQDEVTDDQLRKYALMMEVIDAMKSEISVLTNDMIKNQEGIDGKRYKELAKAGGDAAKLDGLGAKEFEKKFMMLIYEKQEERKDAIKQVNQILATKMLSNGGKSYKAIKAALKSDEAVKTRYEEIAKSLELSDDDA